MTVKNRLILSIVAIFTTLVVAGSMIFIIFAATRGTIIGGVKMHFFTSGQLYGELTTRYTTVPLATGFGNGEGDKVIKTTTGAETLVFNGWQDESANFSLAKETITLTVDNPWVIFYMNFTPSKSTTWLHLTSVALTSESKCDNVEVLCYDVYNTWPIPSHIDPDTFDTWEWGADPIDLREENSTLGTAGWGAPLYIMIRVENLALDASFEGGFEISFYADA